MSKTAEGKSRFEVAIDKNLKEQILAIAKARGKKASEVVEELLQKAISPEKEAKLSDDTELWKIAEPKKPTVPETENDFNSEAFGTPSLLFYSEALQSLIELHGGEQAPEKDFGKVKRFLGEAEREFIETIEV